MPSSFLERVRTDRIGRVAIALALAGSALIPAAYADTSSNAADVISALSAQVTQLSQNQVVGNNLDRSLMHEMIALKQEVAMQDHHTAAAGGAGQTCIYGHNRYTDGAILNVGDVELRCEHTPSVMVGGPPTPMIWHNMGPK